MAVEEIACAGSFDPTAHTVHIMPDLSEMHVANGSRAGFWVQRDSWGNTCALVKTVGGMEAGELSGVPPYFGVKGKGSPKVVADVFDLRTAAIKDAGILLSCPGTYTYSQILPPRWYTRPAISASED